MVLRHAFWLHFSVVFEGRENDDSGRYFASILVQSRAKNSSKNHPKINAEKVSKIIPKSSANEAKFHPKRYQKSMKNQVPETGRTVCKKHEKMKRQNLENVWFSWGKTGILENPAIAETSQKSIKHWWKFKQNPSPKRWKINTKSMLEKVMKKSWKMS